MTWRGASCGRRRRRDLPLLFGAPRPGPCPGPGFPRCFFFPIDSPRRTRLRSLGSRAPRAGYHSKDSSLTGAVRPARSTQAVTRIPARSHISYAVIVRTQKDPPPQIAERPDRETDQSLAIIARYRLHRLSGGENFVCALRRKVFSISNRMAASGTRPEPPITPVHLHHRLRPATTFRQGNAREAPPPWFHLTRPVTPRRIQPTSRIDG